MKKNSFAVPCAVLLASAALTLTAYADDAGWRAENGGWRWYTAGGQYVTDIWKNGADGQDRYLGTDGMMALDTWVSYDGRWYYVDKDGIPLKNVWKQLAPPESERGDSGSDTFWYYFQENGKRRENEWQETSGKWYHLDEYGKMEFGWILDNMYYTGEDGAMLTGWQYLEDPEDFEETTASTPVETGDRDDDGHHYYFFNVRGKKFVPTDGGGIGERTVDGKRYCFDENGAAQFGWVNVEGTEDDSDEPITDYRFYNRDGTLRTGWYSIAGGPETFNGEYDYDVMWFYFGSGGKPYASESETYVKRDLKTIKGKKYLFNMNGTPETGLKMVYDSDGSDSYTAYFFGDRNTCSAQTGKQKVVESNGETVQYYFQTSGAGYTGVHDGYLYYMGRVQTADSEDRYRAVTIPTKAGGEGGKSYLVDSKGKVRKSAKLKDKGGVKYTTNSSGAIIKMDDESVDSDAQFDSPDEPDFETSYYD